MIGKEFFLEVRKSTIQVGLDDFIDSFRPSVGQTSPGVVATELRTASDHLSAQSAQTIEPIDTSCDGTTARAPVTSTWSLVSQVSHLLSNSKCDAGMTADAVSRAMETVYVERDE
jgi:hypothetical protein